MAQLTWQNIEAPNFSGVMQSQAMAADALRNGFGTLQSALNNFKKQRDDQLYATTAADIMRFSDPKALEAAMAAGQINLSDPRAAEFAAQQARNLRANQGLDLNNQNQMLTNDQLGWNNQRVRGYENARPDALAAVTEIRNAFRLGTPEGTARGQQLLADNSQWLAAAGVDINGLLEIDNDNARAGVSALARDEAFRAAGNSREAEADRRAAETLFADVLSRSTPETLAANIRATNADPKVMLQALDMAEKGGPALLGPNADPTQVILDEQLGLSPGLKRIEYANQKADRNLKLSSNVETTMAPVLENLNIRMRVTSGGQVTKEEAAAGKGSRVGSERHDHGGAGDVEFIAADGRVLSMENPKDIPILQEIVRQGKARGLTGFGAGIDYMGPTRMHIGFGEPAVWGKDGSKDFAPQWLKEAYNGAPAGPTAASAPIQDPVQAAISQALQSASAGPNMNTLGQTAEQPKPQTSEDQQLLNTTTQLGNQAERLLGLATADAAFDRNANMVTEIMTRPDANKSEAEIAQQLKTQFGGDEAGGLFTSPDLTLPIIIKELNRIRAKHGLAPDIAAVFLKNAIVSTDNLFFKDNVEVSQKEVDQLISEFIDPKTGKLGGEKLQGTLEQMEQRKVKAAAGQQLQQMMGRVQAAQQEYFNAKARQRTNPGVDVSGPKKRYEALLKMAEQLRNQVDENPLIRANTNSLTGR